MFYGKSSTEFDLYSRISKIFVTVMANPHNRYSNPHTDCSSSLTPSRHNCYSNSPQTPSSAAHTATYFSYFFWYFACVTGSGRTTWSMAVICAAAS